MVKPKALSAGYGLNSWLLQRITAVIMLFAIIAVVVVLILSSQVVNANFISWKQFFSFIFVKIFTQLVFFAVIIHAWVGIRDLWMDYVKSTGMRLFLYTLTILWLVGCLVYSAVILWT